MPVVDMRELSLSVRGQNWAGGDGPPAHIMGMVSSVRSAIRRSHDDSPATGKARIHDSLGRWLRWSGEDNPGRRATATAASNYIDIVHRCADWHAESPLAYQAWELKGAVRYSDSDVVDAVVRVVLEDSESAIWGRLIYWDGPALSIDAARLLASTAVEVLDARYEASNVAGVEVWQCRTRQAHTIDATSARAARAATAMHVAGMTR